MKNALRGLLIAVVMIWGSVAAAQTTTITINTKPSGGWCKFYAPVGNYVMSTPPYSFSAAAPMETVCKDSSGTIKSNDSISLNSFTPTITITQKPGSGGWADFYVNGNYISSTSGSPPYYFTPPSPYQPLEIQYKNSSDTVVVDETYTWRLRSRDYLSL